MRTVPLSQGYKAIVDDDVFDAVSCHKWHVELVNGNPKYAQARLPDGTKIRLHRFVMGCTVGDGIVVDHRNGDGLDNRKTNLRACTQSQNCMNSRRRSHAAASLKGMVWNKARQKWEARIVYKKRQRYLGIFATEEDAAIAYDVAAQLLFGEFALLNKA